MYLYFSFLLYFKINWNPSIFAFRNCKCENNNPLAAKKQPGGCWLLVLTCPGCKHCWRPTVWALSLSRWLDGKAAVTAGQGGLRQWQGSTSRVQTPAASRPAEDDHGEGDWDFHCSQTRHQQGERTHNCWSTKHACSYTHRRVVYSWVWFHAVHLGFPQSQYDTPLLELIGIENEIKLAIEKLAQWAAPRPVEKNLFTISDEVYIQPEPLGVVLIIGAWNYPWALTLIPLVGAIAAGRSFFYFLLLILAAEKSACNPKFTSTNSMQSAKYTSPLDVHLGVDFEWTILRL